MSGLPTVTAPYDCDNQLLPDPELEELLHDFIEHREL